MEVRKQCRDEAGRFYTRVRCTQCEMISINGAPCHETGCPDAWMGRKVECFDCGCDFVPEGRWDRTCPDCANPEPFEDQA